MHAVCDNDPYRRLSWPALISATDGGLYRLPCHPPHIRATRAPFSLRLRDLWSGPHLSALTLKNAFVHFARQPRGRRRLPTCARAALPPQIVCTIIMITAAKKIGLISIPDIPGGHRAIFRKVGGWVSSALRPLPALLRSSQPLLNVADSAEKQPARCAST